MRATRIGLGNILSAPSSGVAIHQMKVKDEDVAHPGMVSKLQKTPNFAPIQYFAMDTLEGCIKLAQWSIAGGQEIGGFESWPFLHNFGAIC